MPSSLFSCTVQSNLSFHHILWCILALLFLCSIPCINCPWHFLSSPPYVPVHSHDDLVVIPLHATCHIHASIPMSLMLNHSTYSFLSADLSTAPTLADCTCISYAVRGYISTAMGVAYFMATFLCIFITNDTNTDCQHQFFSFKKTTMSSLAQHQTQPPP